MKARSLGAIALAALLGVAAPSASHQQALGSGLNWMTSPDTAGIVGDDSSLELDASGNPVISYHAEGDLKLLHCGNPNCTSGNVIASPDTAGLVGAWTSLDLDAAGNPVVSYYDLGNGDLKLLHCGNATCTAGNTIASPDTTGLVGSYSSLVLDSAGNPVISYLDDTNNRLKVLHCGNASCTSGNTIQAPDPAINTGWHSSIALDAAGNPVLSYTQFQFGQTDIGTLHILHCGDPACASGNSIAMPDSPGSGSFTSLALDASGNPVVSYSDHINDDLKVLHCGNATCTAGNSITVPDSAGVTGQYTSLRLDGAGYPVVAYYDRTVDGDGDLKLLRCGDPNCSSGNSITFPDTTGDVGWYPSLALDSSGYPVVSYLYFTNGDLKTLHCIDPRCDGVAPKDGVMDTDGDTVPNDADPDDDADGCADALEAKKLAASGGLRDPHSFWDFFDVPAPARDQAVSALDLFAVLGRFTATGDPGIDPLSAPPPAPAYHTAFDRGPSPGPYVWNVTAADGSIASTDIFAVLAQFTHSCA